MDSTSNPAPTSAPAAPAGLRLGPAAIFVGATVGASLALLLSILGVGVGAYTFDTFTSGEGLGRNDGIWHVVFVSISLFFGGWITSRLARPAGVASGALRGAVTWILAAGLGVWVVTVLSAGLADNNARISSTGVPVVVTHRSATPAAPASDADARSATAPDDEDDSDDSDGADPYEVSDDSSGAAPYDVGDDDDVAGDASAAEPAVAVAPAPRAPSGALVTGKPTAGAALGDLLTGLAPWNWIVLGVSLLAAVIGGIAGRPTAARAR